LARAYHEYRNHEILKNMLGPSGKLKVYHASEETLTDLMHFSPASHQYWMPDHGLFVAGIIHTIAPDAELHLHEALGPYGVGSFTSVTQALLQAIDKAKDRSLIINCSFMFDIPKDPGPDLGLPPALQKASIQSITDVFAWVTSLEKVQVVASAGNDAKSSESRPTACYPAAFDEVWGIGALPKRYVRTSAGYQTAAYSNISDKPSTAGYVVFGGESGFGNGVLGAYISDFPQRAGCLPSLLQMLRWKAGERPAPGTFRFDQVKYQANKTGWAWWAGTSFAAPVLSGILAAGGLPANDATPGVVRPVGPYKTKDNETVILVQQG
jgi:hypothetical protein